jgi:hypothetical protein
VCSLLLIDLLLIGLLFYTEDGSDMFFPKRRALSKLLGVTTQKIAVFSCPWFHWAFVELSSRVYMLFKEEEVAGILWNPTVQYRDHWSLSWARSIQSIHTHPKIHFNIVHPHTYVLVLLVVSFLLAFPQISYMHSSLPCPSHSSWSLFTFQLFHENVRPVCIWELFLLDPVERYFPEIVSWNPCDKPAPGGRQIFCKADNRYCAPFLRNTWIFLITRRI